MLCLTENTLHTSSTSNARATVCSIEPIARKARLILHQSQRISVSLQSQYTVAVLISALCHANSPAKMKRCQVPLFQCSLPKSPIQAGKCPATGWAQEAAMANILTQK